MSVNNAQPPISLSMYAVVVTAIVFSVVLTLSACGKEKGNQWVFFSSVSELKTYLSAFPEQTYNSPPHRIKLNISDNDMIQLRDLLLEIKNKYLYLDLSGSTITTIQSYAFIYGTTGRTSCFSLTGIIMPNSVTSIEEYAFKDCTGLVIVTIPKSVTSIGVRAFYYCKELTHINVDSDNSEYSAEKGVLYNKDKTILHTYSAGKTDTSFNIPDSVTNIGNSAFFDCNNLVGVTIPNSVTSIGDYAFYYCSNLVRINIPNSVTNIGNSAFYGCTNLTNITIGSGVTNPESTWLTDMPSLTAINVNDGNSIYSSQEGVLYNKAKTSLIKYPASKKGNTFTIPSSVTSIGEKAFSESDLVRIIIPDSVTSIEDSAFSGCRKLVTINIPIGVTSIGYKAFNECTNLINITIPDNVTKIGNSAFWGCDSLAKVTIPDGLTSIGDQSFYNCPSLTGIVIPESVTSIGFNAFENCTKLTSVTFEGTIKREIKYYDDGCGGDDEYYDNKDNDETFYENSFLGDLFEKFYEKDAEKGTPGTYTTTAPVSKDSIWTRKR